MSTETQGAASEAETQATKTSPAAFARLFAKIDACAAMMSERHARERIASLVVLSILQIAVALLVLSHAPDGVGALSSVGFVLSLCLAFNGALVLVCRRRIAQTVPELPR